MSILQISDTEMTGELRWGIALVDDEGTRILKNTVSLAPGVASSTAKALKFKGADAPTLKDAVDDHSAPAWFVEKGGNGWLARFTLITETTFDLLLKPEDTQGDLKVAEQALERVKSNLAKAEIKWDPPEADPAFEDKASVVTPTVGHPGS